MPAADFIVKISANLIGFDSKVEAAKRKVTALAGSVRDAGAAISIGITAPIVGLGTAALSAFGEIDALKRGLAGLEGSAQGAERRFRELLEVAKLPGLGIQEAIQADLALRNYGFSAEKAKQVTLQFGNALALAGRGKEDLAELTRQMGQLKSRGIPTMDNLRTIMERIPQSAAIIQKQFGTINTEVLQKMGVTSDQLIESLLKGLSSLQRVEGGWKNAMENMADSAKLALNEIGSALAPAATRFAEQFVVPAIEGAKSLAQRFKELPDAAQTAIIGFGAIAAASGPVLYALGTLAGSLTNIILLFGKLPAAATIATAALNISPWVLLGGSIAYAVLQIKEWVSVQQDAQNADRSTAQMFFNTIDVLSNAGADMDNFRRKYEDLIRQLKNARDLGLPISPAALQTLRAANAELVTLAKTWVPLTEEAKKTTKATEQFGVAAKEAKEHVRPLQFETVSLTNALIAMRAEAERHNYQTLLKSVDQLQDFLRKNADRALDFAQSFQFIGDGWKTGEKVFDEMNAQLKVSLQYWPILPNLIGSTADALRDFAGTLAADALANINAGMRVFKEEADQNARLAKIGIEINKQGQKDMEEANKKRADAVKKANEDMRRHVQKHFHELSRDLADLLFKGGKFGDVMANTFKRIGQSLVSAAIEKQLSRVAGLLVDIIGKSGIAGKVLGAVFGAGASAAGGAASAAGGIAGAAGSAAGVAGSAAGVAGQAVGAGLSGVVGAVGSVVSAISGVIGNFQMAGMNKSLDLIEKATRYSEAYLLQLVHEVQQWLPKLNDVHNRLKQMVDTGIGVYNQPGDQGLRIVGGGGNGAVSLTFSQCSFSGTTQADVDRFMRAAIERLRLGGQI